MNPRHERFALELFKGKRQAAAYRLAFPDAKGTPAKLVWEKASRLASSPMVRARLAELQDAAKTDAVADARELAEYLTRIIRTPVGRVRADSDLAQEVEGGKVRRIKLPSKLDAVDRLCRLMGYYAPEQRAVAVQVSPVADMTDEELRAIVGP